MAMSLQQGILSFRMRRGKLRTAGPRRPARSLHPRAVLPRGTVTRSHAWSLHEEQEDFQS
jgi:hypothetical protein